MTRNLAPTAVDTVTPMLTDAPLSLLRLMYLVSPTLPIGAYAYSTGQEYVVDAGWATDATAVQEWIRSVMWGSLSSTDLPAIKHVYLAWQDEDVSRLEYWNAWLHANRETAELLLEDQQLGAALTRVLVAHSVEGAQSLADEKPAFVLPFALAGLRWDVPLPALMQGFCWSWLENQVAAATKTVPLGQTQAQHILMALLDEVPGVVAQAEALREEEMGVGLPALAIASACHERQYSRLFRS